MTTCRIDFTGSGTLCGGGEVAPVRISRTQPAPMTAYMNQTAWNDFCDKIDKAVQPLARVRKVSGIIMVVCLIGFIAFPVISIFSMMSSFNNDPWSSNSSSSGPGASFVGFLIGPLLMMAGLIATSCWAANQGQVAMRAVESVCEDISKQYSALSFHVRFEYHIYRTGSYNDRRTRSTKTNYIECNIASSIPPAEATISAPAVMVQPSAPPAYYSGGGEAEIPVVTASAVGGGSSSSSKTPAERLAELEQMRPMLTSKEYEQKRAEILESV